MKLPEFDYVRPSTLAEVTDLLASADGNARLIAGGQSLVPLLAFRLAAPEMLIDLRGLKDFNEIVVDDTTVRMGAMVRWRDIATNPALKNALPLLPAAIEHVAHYQIQNRGTIGGSLGHADPAAEFPCIAITCDAVISVANTAGTREIAAKDLIVGPLETCLSPDDVITEVRFDIWPPRRRWAFDEFSRRRGDFAIAAVAVFYDVDADGNLENAHIGVMGASDITKRLTGAEACLNGQPIGKDTIAAAARIAAEEVEPPSDSHGSADYRRSLVSTLLTRMLRRTMEQEFQ